MAELTERELEEKRQRLEQNRSRRGFADSQDIDDLLDHITAQAEEVERLRSQYSTLEIDWNELDNENERLKTLLDSQSQGRASTPAEREQYIADIARVRAESAGEIERLTVKVDECSRLHVGEAEYERRWRNQTQRNHELTAEVARLKDEQVAYRRHSDHVIGEYVKDIERLTAEVTHLKGLIEQEARDWAETDTAIRELCRPYTDVDGDSTGVPAIEDVVEETVARLKGETNRLANLNANISSEGHQYAEENRRLKGEVERLTNERNIAEFDSRCALPEAQSVADFWEKTAKTNRADLAKKVLAAVESKYDEWRAAADRTKGVSGSARYSKAHAFKATTANEINAWLIELFTAEGIEMK